MGTWVIDVSIHHWKAKTGNKDKRELYMKQIQKSHVRGRYIVGLEIVRMLSDDRAMDDSHGLGHLGGIDASIHHWKVMTGKKDKVELYMKQI